eukprot:4216583-Pyramimonas_sp.AAC.1
MQHPVRIGHGHGEGAIRLPPALLHRYRAVAAKGDEALVFPISPSDLQVERAENDGNDAAEDVDRPGDCFGRFGQQDDHLVAREGGVNNVLFRGGPMKHQPKKLPEHRGAEESSPPARHATSACPAAECTR